MIKYISVYEVMTVFKLINLGKTIVILFLPFTIVYIYILFNKIAPSICKSLVGIISEYKLSSDIHGGFKVQYSQLVNGPYRMEGLH